MKNRLLFLVTIILMSLFVSCNRTEFEVADNVNGDRINVKINFGGDYVDISSRPLLPKSDGESGKAYYAFEIDSLRTLNPRESDPFGTGWFPYSYAEGLFDGDHINNLTVSLEKGHRYRIRCSIIIDQEDKLFVDGDNCVYEPFAPNGSKAQIRNMFLYGGEKSVWATQVGSCAVVNDNERVLYLPKLDRYFGEAFTEGDPVTIQMERCNIGFDFVIVAPQEGSLHVSNWNPPYFSFDLQPGSPTVRESHIYDIGLMRNEWNLEVPSTGASCKLIVKWTKENGEEVDLSPELFMVPNKTIMTIKVDINERIGGSDIGIEIPEGGMDHSEVVIN